VSVPLSYFTDKYDRSPDPWSLDSRWYDRRKYQLTVASLPRPSYRRAFEPACSVGVLTEMLAPRCESLLATDAVPAAVDAARARVAHLPHVSVAQQRVPEDWPDGRFDLIVLSELGYYLPAEHVRRLGVLAAESLDNDGALVAVHWRHRIEDLPLTGDDVHAIIAATAGIERLGGYADHDVLIDVFVPAPAISVAAAENLIEPDERRR